MRWGKISPYALRTECQRYTVAKTLHSGVPIYGAWRANTLLADFDTPEKAKACCEEHADAQKAAA